MKIRYLIATLALTSCTSAMALDQIIRPYQSVRSAGMGGVRMSTGLYDENFFNNPARVTANPESKLTLFQITPVETSNTTINAISDASGDANVQTVAKYAGSNIHYRFQLILPAYYLASNTDRKWALAIGIITSLQADAIARNSFQGQAGLILDTGPAATFGHKFLEDDSLSVGATAHVAYRTSANPSYTIGEYLNGASTNLNTFGGQGSQIDFDLGATYKLYQFDEFKINVAGAVQNLLGGNYTNLGFKPLKFTLGALPQPRSFGFGANIERDVWGPFERSVFAIEATDIGNNTNGSFYKLLHIGGETRWKSVAVRLGLNQGYFAAGLGLDVHYFTLDLATYGEELGLNTGTIEDRRYTLNFGVHI